MMVMKSNNRFPVLDLGISRQAKFHATLFSAELFADGFLSLQPPISLHVTSLCANDIQSFTSRSTSEYKSALPAARLTLFNSYSIESGFRHSSHIPSIPDL